MSGVLLAPSEGKLWLPDGTLWTPPPSAEGIPLERIVPRVCLVPDTAADWSAGIECIELAEAAGLILDPWQQLDVLLILARTARHRWAAFMAALIVARQNGKGSILEALELYWLFVCGERLIGHSAHEYKTAMEGFRRILFLIENSDFLRKRVKKVINTNGEEGIELLTGQRLRFMARSKGAGRGFTFHKLVWDEGYALTRDQQSAQLPTMSAVDDPQIVITSSPPLTSDTGEVLFQTQRVARALGAKLTFLDYGAEGDLDNLDDINLDDVDLWRRTNPSEVHAGTGHGVSVEFMEGERINLDDPGFARERLCIWPPDLEEGYGVISKDQWDAMCDPLSGSDKWQEKDMPHPSTPAYSMTYLKPPTQLVGRPVLALRVSPRVHGAVNGAVGLASNRYDGKRHIEVIARDSGTAWMIPALRAFLKANPNTGGIALDPGSPTGSLLADVLNLLTELDLSHDLLLKMSSQAVAGAFGMIYDAANEPTPSVVHIGQPEQEKAIGGAVARNVGIDGKTWDAKLSTTDVTGLAAVTDALWGLAQPATQAEDAEVLVMWA